MRPLSIRLAATLVSVLAISSVGVRAAENTDLTVKGTIRPAACNITTSDSEINLGSISAQRLSGTAATTLPSHNFSITLTCDAAAKVALKTFDGRSGTIQGDARQVLGASGDYDAYGLGAVDGLNIGAYTVRRTGRPTADGGNVSSLVSRNHGSTWAAQEDNGFLRSWPTNSSMFSWATSGTTPGSFTTIAEEFTLTPAIGPTSKLPNLNNNVALDGLATFEVRYL